MESFARYRRAGVNLSLGTDTNPQSVIEAMRWAAVVSKLVERNTEVTNAAHVFDAATLGGARASGATTSAGSRRARRPISCCGGARRGA